MASRRMISSEIWNDELVGELNYFERCLWIGLFSSCADDQGRLKDNPILIRAEVFPYDDIAPGEIDKALEHIASINHSIQRYKVDGKQYIQLLKWWEHQRPQWASASAYPAPEGWIDRVRTRENGNYYQENWTLDERADNSAEISNSSPNVNNSPVQVVRQSPVPIPVPVSIPVPSSLGGVDGEVNRTNEIIGYLCKKAEIPMPMHADKKTRWEWLDPVMEMLGIFDGDAVKTKAQIDKAISRADEKHLTFSNAKGILNIYKAMIGEQKRGVGKSDNEKVLEAWAKKGVKNGNV